MNHNHFAAVTRALATMPSRRDILRGLAGAGLGLGAARLPWAVEAKKKHRNHDKSKKRKRKKHKQPQPAQPNEFGCLEVDQPCHGDNTLCCSGVCESVAPKKGKPDTRRCAAHGAGTCDQEGVDFCLASSPAEAFACNNSSCECIRTTAGSRFCAGVVVTACADCQKDADCEALGFPIGSACAPFSQGRCAGACATGTACLAPCGALAPPS